MPSPSKKTIDTILAHCGAGVANRKIRIEIFKQFAPDWYVTLSESKHPDVCPATSPTKWRIGFWRIRKGILMIESDAKGEYDPKKVKFLSFHTTTAISETLGQPVRDLDRLITGATIS